MHVIKNEYLRMPKNEYLHENNQNLNKNGYGNNGGENGGFTGTASYTHRTPFVIARFWLVNTGAFNFKERKGIHLGAMTICL